MQDNDVSEKKIKIKKILDLSYWILIFIAAATAIKNAVLGIIIVCIVIIATNIVHKVLGIPMKNVKEDIEEEEYL